MPNITRDKLPTQMPAKQGHPYELPTPEFLAKVEPLAEGLLSPKVDGTGRETFPTLPPESQEWKSLKIKPHSQFGGLRPDTTPAAAVISWVPPAQIVRSFGSAEAAITTGQRLRNGEILLYGLQTSAIRFTDPAIAESLVAAAPNMRILFSYLDWLIDIIPSEKMDRLMLLQTESWVPEKDLLQWMLLEKHTQWSSDLSQRMIDAVEAHGSESNSRWWQFAGNGFAHNMHPTLLQSAKEVLKPFAKTESNAKRWTNKLSQRIKELESE